METIGSDVSISQELKQVHLLNANFKACL